MPACSDGIVRGPAGCCAPTGSMMPFAGTVAPTGYQFCLGQSIAVAAFPALFAVIGYTYGGAGANFNVPDMRDRFPLGLGPTFGPIASSGGASNHTHPLPGTGFVGAGAATRGAGALPTTVSGDALAGATGVNAVNTMPPYRVLNFIIKN